MWIASGGVSFLWIQRVIGVGHFVALVAWLKVIRVSLEEPEFKGGKWSGDRY